MEFINEKELQKTKGGISIWGVVGLSALASFIVGIFDGIARPIKCYK